MKKQIRLYRSAIILMSPLIASLITSNAVASPANTDTINNTNTSKIWIDASKSPDTQEVARLAKRLGQQKLKARRLYFNRDQFKHLLGNTPIATDASVNSNSNSLKNAAKPTTKVTAKTISIPLPAGGFARVNIVPSDVMSPELARQHPQIKTWRIQEKGNYAIRGRVDLTPRGFHAMLIMPNSDTIYVEPENNSPDNEYLSFSKHDNHDLFHSDFKCGVKHDVSPVLPSGKSGMLKRNLAKVARKKILYRLAVAATGEYTQYHGGDKDSALSAIITTINRVNEIYEEDLSVTLQLIPEEKDIIYTNPNTDPYTNDDLEALVDENILNLSDANALSRDKYDIGHLFSAGDVSGLSTVGSVCNTTAKAGGVTGISNPIGDAFSVDFVAHELGHQLGATHTFNSYCGGNQRNQETAVEPGSGSTIMSYAGVCGDNDIQNHVDPQFHAISIAQVSNFIRIGAGSHCGFIKSSSNNKPTVNAGSDYTIPTGTPFMLKASGDDSDGDQLSYTWEQMDTGLASDKNVDTGDNALFRSRPASTSGTRYIPRIIDMFNNTSSDGEFLPVYERNAHFISTVRDGRGGIATDEMTMNFVNSNGYFEVTSHQTARTLATGDTTTVSWDVADTDRSPINCSQVDISLINSSQRKQFLKTTSNDGVEAVTLPDNAILMTRARMMVECHSKPFFALSSGDLKIVQGNSSSSSGSGSSGGGLFNYLLLAPLLLLSVYRRKGKKND